MSIAEVFCWNNTTKKSPKIYKTLINSDIIRETNKERVVTISSLWELTDEKLLEAYQKATLLNLDPTFIEMLIEEIDNRGIESLKIQCVS